MLVNSEFDSKLINQFKKYALEQYPKEAVAIISDGRLVTLENKSKNPINSFEVDPLLVFNNKPQALLHSHTYGLQLDNPIIDAERLDIDGRTPSYADWRGFMRMRVPWGIFKTEGENVSDPVWLDDNRNRDLIKRNFMFYITDCWTLCRDWYWQEKRIYLPHYPDLDWDNNGTGIPDNAYYDQAEGFGFYEVELNDLEEGDVVLMSTAKRNDHGGIYLGNNRILHHFTGRPSGIWDTGKLRSFISGALRYRG